MKRIDIAPLLAVLILFGTADAAQAQVRGISYTLSPEVDRVYFDRNAGLEQDYLYGGAIGFGVGQYIELSGLYLMNPRISRNLADITGVDGPMREALLELPIYDVSMNQYGGRLRLNLSSGGLVPFVTLGTGVLQFNAEELNRSRHIYGSAGAGVQLTSGDRYAISIGAENFAYRYNLGATFFSEEDLASVGLTRQNFGQTLVYNWSVRAALKVYIGGADPGAMTDVDYALRNQLSGGLRGLRLVVEPFYGYVDFGKELNFAPGQRFAGVFSGIDMGPYAGLRGFYWRAMPEDEIAFQDLQAFGGELRLALSSGRNITPVVTLGGGYLDVLEDYEGRDGARPSGEPFAMGGAMLRIPLSDQIQVTGGLRMLLISSAGVDNLTEPSDIYFSTMLTGGIRFAVGGRSAEQPPMIAEDVEVDEADDPRAAEIRRLRRQIAELEQARGDSIAAAEDLDAVQAQDLSAPRAEAPSVRTYRSNQMVSIPVPEEGEIYIRYGPPPGTITEPIPGGRVALVDTTTVQVQSGAITAAEIQRIVRETVRAELADYEGTTTDGVAMARLEQQINARLDELATRVDRAALRQIDPSPVIVDRRPDADRVTIIDGRTTRSAPGLVAGIPFLGMTAGDASSLTLGVRGDYRTDFLSFLNWHPEFAVGFGTGGYSYNLNAHGVYSLDFLKRITPYAGVGFGILGFNEPPEDVPGVQFLFNIVTGAEFSYGRSRLFAEYAAMDIGDYHRLIVGYRFGL